MIDNFERFTPEGIEKQLSGAVFSKKKDKEKQIFKDIITFDIETTSVNKEKAVMYIWQICINGRCFYGRTWSEFQQFIQLLNTYGSRFYIWVHNLSFEFAFIQSFLDFSGACKVHESHSVRECEYKNITFRCTYFMTNLSLAKVAENNGLEFEKLDGEEFDYSKRRYSFTPLTPMEEKYCQHDVLILWAYIKTFDKAWNKIPSTATGFTRKLYKDNIRQYGDEAKINRICQEDVCSDLEEFEILQNSFAGGYTHANSRYIGFLLENVRSRDKTSFYPSIMARYKFPRKMHRLNSDNIEETFYKYLNERDENGERVYFMCVRVGFTNIRAKTHITTISEHKCLELSGSYYGTKYRDKRTGEEHEKPDIDNGRVASARHLLIDITSLDFETIQAYYDFDEVVIIKGLFSRLRYLPVSMLMTMLELYAQKTELKNVEGKEELYQSLKALLNSLFGVCVTCPLREKWVYNNYEFSIEPPSEDKAKEKEEKEKALRDYARNHGVLYQWGCYITAVARWEILQHNLAMIDTQLSDYRVIYNDTDSLKYLYDEYTEKYFNDFDEYTVKPQLQRCFQYLKDNIPDMEWRYFEPVDIEGRKHLLGIMEVEGTYKYFKTLGAKRYIHTDTNKAGQEVLKVTVAGCPKAAMKEELMKHGTTWEEIFSAFRFDLEVKDCKSIHYYTKPSEPEVLQDYTGKSGLVHFFYGVSLLPTSFKMTQASRFKDFLTIVLPQIHFSVYEYYKTPVH